MYHSNRGSISVTVLLATALILELGAVAIFVTNQGMTRSVRERNLSLALHVAEAGVQAESDAIWTQFKVSQSFVQLDSQASSATPESPAMAISKLLATGQRYTVAVIGNTAVDAYNRDVTILSVGWLDSDNDSQLDAGEPRKAIRCVMRFSLTRAGVFDYAYFVNNYGWMNGFSSTQLVVNGDMRANGNFDFSGGTPTINGSVYAAQNDSLIPGAPGVVNITPNQYSNSTYTSLAGSRWRQAYDASTHGAKGTTTYDSWRDLIYDKSASLVNDEVSGAVVGDRAGVRSYSGTVLDPAPTTILPMPDLSDLSHYTDLSSNYVDPKAQYGDGTANPYYGQEAYLEVWDSSSSSYQRLTTSGVVTGSAVAIGTSTHPIKIHGPVTVTEDAVIKGVVEGQGTIYTGRNVHVVGSITYKDPPDFRGSNPQTIDNVNEKKSIIALAARASIMMGDTSTFGSYPLNYMKPPFTHPRYDEYGNYVPAFDATQVDSYGKKKYQSVLGDSYIHSVSSSVSQIDAVLYTNFLGGGNIGTGGGGVTFNGTIISKDEAMILWSLPFQMNYDNRIRERSISGSPLIDIDLPRTPTVRQLTWQEVVQ